MRLYYTTPEPPFNEEELKEVLHGTKDRILESYRWEVPYTAVDPDVPCRYDEYNVYSADSIAGILEKLPEALSLGIILIVDKALILGVGAAKDVQEPGKIDEFFIRGVSTPFLIAMVSVEGLTHTQALKAFKHEMGHFYAIPHCGTTTNCLMTSFDYNDIELLEGLDTELCPNCKEILNKNLRL